MLNSVKGHDAVVSSQLLNPESTGGRQWQLAVATDFHPNVEKDHSSFTTDGTINGVRNEDDNKHFPSRTSRNDTGSQDVLHLIEHPLVTLRQTCKKENLAKGKHVKFYAWARSQYQSKAATSVKQKQTGAFDSHSDIGPVRHPGDVHWDAADQSYTVSGSGTHRWLAKMSSISSGRK